MPRIVLLFLCNLLIFSLPISTFDDQEKPSKILESAYESAKSWWGNLTEQKKKELYQGAQAHIANVVTPNYVQKNIIDPNVPYLAQSLATEGIKWGAGITLASGGLWWLYNTLNNMGLRGLVRASQHCNYSAIAFQNMLIKEFSSLENRSLSEKEKRKIKYIQKLIATTETQLTALQQLKTQFSNLLNQSTK